MLFLLYGKDSFRRNLRLREIRDEYLKQNPDSFGETLVDADEDEKFEKFEVALSQGGGLFGAKALVVARGYFAKDKSRILEALKNGGVKDSKSVHVVLIEGFIKKSSELNEILELAVAEEFHPLSREERIKWIARYVKSRGGNGAPTKINKRAAEHLAELGDDLQGIASEIEKLLAYSCGEDSITEKQVAQLVRKPIEETIFPLSDGVCERSPIQALKALMKLTADGQDVDGLISYTIKEARQMIRAKAALEAEIPGDPEKLFGAKPFVWRKRTKQSGKWSDEDIKMLSSRIVSLDVSWKSGADKRLALERFILESG